MRWISEMTEAEEKALRKLVTKLSGVVL
jgi:hypothetical protein